MALAYIFGDRVTMGQPTLLRTALGAILLTYMFLLHKFCMLTLAVRSSLVLLFVFLTNLCVVGLARVVLRWDRS